MLELSPPLPILLLLLVGGLSLLNTRAVHAVEGYRPGVKPAGKFKLPDMKYLRQVGATIYYTKQVTPLFTMNYKHLLQAKR
jgi:hypothetical protein